MALLREVSTARLDAEIVEKASPEGDHQQNALAEVSVREVKIQARVMNSDLEARHHARLQYDEPILAWWVRHAANVIVGASEQTTGLPSNEELERRGPRAQHCSATCVSSSSPRRSRWTVRQCSANEERCPCVASREDNRLQNTASGRSTRPRFAERLQRYTVGRQDSNQRGSCGS